MLLACIQICCGHRFSLLSLQVRALLWLEHFDGTERTVGTDESWSAFNASTVMYVLVCCAVLCCAVLCTRNTSVSVRVFILSQVNYVCITKKEKE